MASSSTQNSNIYVGILLFLSILLIFISIKDYIKNKQPTKDTFIQQPPFVIKQNEYIYDSFYSNVYDQIFHPEKNEDIIDCFKTTQPVPEKSVILDIGSGTGELLNTLQKNGFQKSFGLEKSVPMALQCLQKYPHLKIKIGDAENLHTYGSSIFTHVFCIGMTIYEIKNKKTFFQNCNHWMKPNSYLFLHLVNRNHFDTILPCGKPYLMDDVSPQKYSSSRITQTETTLKDGVKFKSTYDFSKKDVVTFTEQFTANSKVRKNERELYMSENMEDIFYNARNCGFIVVGQRKFKHDDNQFLFILEKI